MKTKYLFIAALGILTLASCADDGFVGDKDALNGAISPITFGSGTPTVTRADKVGAAAATDLNNQFVVFGYKTINSTPQTVFNNYQANFVSNTANTTTSNSANWEYVGYKHLSANMSNNAGVTANATGEANDQTIKYWDYGADNYKFYAYSLGAVQQLTLPQVLPSLLMVLSSSQLQPALMPSSLLIHLMETRNTTRSSRS